MEATALFREVTVIVLHVAHLDQYFLLFSSATVPAGVRATAALKLCHVRIEFELYGGSDLLRSFAAANFPIRQTVLLLPVVTAPRRTSTILSKIGLVVGTFLTLIGDDPDESVRLFLVS